ncbi:uncharacterized protein LOC116404778 [Cucumis sativus]|nr:uncharacterized protein LOC116404778 [Cucumis sativus]
MLPNFSPSFIAGLQMTHEFFNLYISDRTYQFRFSLRKFYTFMYRMELQGFSSMLFTVDMKRLLSVYLTFENNNAKRERRRLKLLAYDLDLDGDIEYTTFVSIDSRDFRRIASELNSRSVSVTFTNSRVNFFNKNKEITFSKEENQCVIGGVEEGEEFRFIITVHPLVFFLDLSSQSKRVWFLMQRDFSCIMILPLGLWQQFWVYFPSQCHIHIPLFD